MGQGALLHPFPVCIYTGAAHSVQKIPAGFQKLYNFLPMSYTIKLLKEYNQEHIIKLLEKLNNKFETLI